MASFGSFSAPADVDAQTRAEIERTHSRLQAADLATRPGQTVFDGKDQPTHPAHLIRATPEDDERMQAVQALLATGQYKQPSIDDRVINFYRDKQKNAEYIQREQWLAARFDLSNPVVANWFREVLPSFTERRKRFAEQKLAMQKQLLDLALYGPRSEEDFDFLFAIETGKIDLNELRRPVWEKPENAKAASEDYVSGWFAPPKAIVNEHGDFAGERAIPKPGAEGGGMFGYLGNKDPAAGFAPAPHPKMLNFFGGPMRPSTQGAVSAVTFQAPEIP